MRQLIEYSLPEIAAFRIMIEAGSCNVGEDTLAFLLDCETGETNWIDVRGAG